MTAMTKYLAGVLSVIALGTTVIAYSLVFPGGASMDLRAADGLPRPVPVTLVDDPSAQYGAPAAAQYGAPAASPYDERYATAPASPAYAYRTSDVPMAVSPVQPVRTVRTVDVEPAPRRVTTRTVERAPRRDWKKAAMVIGGSTAAGAGVGGIFGGKKGALIGAAIAGGASTIYQTTR